MGNLIKTSYSNKEICPYLEFSPTDKLKTLGNNVKQPSIHLRINKIRKSIILVKKFGYFQLFYNDIKYIIKGREIHNLIKSQLINFNC